MAARWSAHSSSKPSNPHTMSVVVVMPAARATVVSRFAGPLFVGSAVGAILVADLAEADRYQEIFLIFAATTVPLVSLAVWGRATWRRPEEEPA